MTEINTKAAIAILEQLLNIYRPLQHAEDLLRKLNSAEATLDGTLKAIDKAAEQKAAKDVEIAQANAELAKIKEDSAKELAELDKDRKAKLAAIKAQCDKATAAMDKELAAKEKELAALVEKNKLQADEYVQTQSNLVEVQRKLDEVRKAAAALSQLKE